MFDDPNDDFSFDQEYFYILEDEQFEIDILTDHGELYAQVPVRKVFDGELDTGYDGTCDERGNCDICGTTTQYVTANGHYFVCSYNCLRKAITIAPNIELKKRPNFGLTGDQLPFN